MTTAQPSPLALGLPTVASAGLPGFESGATTGLFAPAGTPVALINRLNHETVRVLNTTTVKDRLFNVGVQAVGSSPEDLADLIKSDMVKWGKVIRDAGIRDQ